MRKRIVAGNWKMNKGIEDGLGLITDICQMLSEKDVFSTKDNVQVMIAPPFILLNACATLLKAENNLSCAAQNCHSEEKGAYTGEVSASMIASCGASGVIIGHSERRQYFGESDEFLAAKVDAAIRCGLTPIFCCGEILEERNDGRQMQIVGAQITQSLFHLSPEDFSKLIIAYEPVWAIGTGLTASPEQAQEMHIFIRKLIGEKYGSEAAESVSILYGGSCNAGNAVELFSQPDIDGGLIGGASLKAEDFVSIIQSLP